MVSKSFWTVVSADSWGHGRVHRWPAEDWGLARRDERDERPVNHPVCSFWDASLSCWLNIFFKIRSEFRWETHVLVEECGKKNVFCFHKGFLSPAIPPVDCKRSLQSSAQWTELPCSCDDDRCGFWPVVWFMHAVGLPFLPPLDSGPSEQRQAHCGGSAISCYTVMDGQQRLLKLIYQTRNRLPGQTKMIDLRMTRQWHVPELARPLWTSSSRQTDQPELLRDGNLDWSKHVGPNRKPASWLQLGTAAFILYNLIHNYIYYTYIYLHIYIYIYYMYMLPPYRPTNFTCLLVFAVFLIYFW